MIGRDATVSSRGRAEGHDSVSSMRAKSLGYLPRLVVRQRRPPTAVALPSSIPQQTGRTSLVAELVRVGVTQEELEVAARAYDIRDARDALVDMLSAERSEAGNAAIGWTGVAVALLVGDLTLISSIQSYIYGAIELVAVVAMSCATVASFLTARYYAFKARRIARKSINVRLILGRSAR